MKAGQRFGQGENQSGLGEGENIEGDKRCLIEPVLILDSSKSRTQTVWRTSLISCPKLAECVCVPRIHSQRRSSK